MPADLQSAPFGRSGTDPGTEHASACAGRVTTLNPCWPEGPPGLRCSRVAYPNFPDKHALDSIAEPAAVHRYWVDHGVLPAEHEAPDGVILLDQAPLTDAVLAGRLGPVSPFP